MARKRQIDPDIWTSEQFINLSLEARLMFIGLISLADDEGRLKGNPLYLKTNLYPADNYTTDKINKWRDEVINQLLTRLYHVDGQEFLWLPNFKKYQYMTKRFSSKLPPFEAKLEPVNDKLMTGCEELYGIGIGIGIEDGNGIGASKLFDEFWGAYPKKKAKQDALKAFMKIKLNHEVLQNILLKLELAKKSDDWLKDNGQFIPFPATWLNGKRWEDEISQNDKEGGIDGKSQKRFPADSRAASERAMSTREYTRR